MKKESLAEAQENKYQLLIDSLDIKPHHKVLEIGCGWVDLPNMLQKKLVAL